MSSDQSVISPAKKRFVVWQEVKSWVLVILIALGLKSTIIASYHVPTGSMEQTILIGDCLLGNAFIYGSRTPDWIGIPYTDIGFDIPWVRLPAFRKPASGDIVIFKSIEDQRTNIVKRCIAGPGQTIEIKNRQIFVDEVPFQDFPGTQYLKATAFPESLTDTNVFPNGYGNADFFHKLYIPVRGDTLRFGRYPIQMIKSIVERDHHSFMLSRGQLIIDKRPADYYIAEQDYFFMMGDNRDNSWDSRFWGLVPYDAIVGKVICVYFSFNKTYPLYDFKNFIRWNRFGKTII
jgi:signal peptidase I